MTPDDFKHVPTAVLAELVLCTMRNQVSQHKQFLVLMGVAYFTALEAVKEDTQPDNVEEALVKQLVLAPGRLTDSRINTLAPKLLQRVLGFEKRLEDFAVAESWTAEEWHELLKDIKQLNADVAPVYAWREELRRDLVRATAETN
jgi:hypothetical protein